MALSIAPLFMLFSLSGCGADVTSKPQLGPIIFTDATGKAASTVTAMTVGKFIYLDVAVGDDPQMLGVNWTATCNNELPPGTPLPPGQSVDESCGFFTPVHTLSGPVPSYATGGEGIVTTYQAPASQPNPARVTLIASSTADPTRFSSITLSILP